MRAYLILTMMSCITTTAFAEIVDRPDHHAPFGVMTDHTHNANEWMVSYRYRRVSMADLRNDHNDVSPKEIPYPVAPTDMTIQMHMLGLMYAPSDNLTLSFMLPHISKKMDHERKVGDDFTTESAGIGDVSVSGLINFFDADGIKAHFTLGLSVPTGSIDREDDGQHLPYPMQIGTGSYMSITGITVTSFFDEWSMGGQWMAFTPLNDNDNDYRVGERFEYTGWLAAQVSPHVSLSARLSYEQWANYNGRDKELAISPSTVPTADPRLRAGYQIDGAVGANIALGGGHRLAAEVEMPIRRELDGPQLERNLVFTLGYQKTF